MVNYHDRILVLEQSDTKKSLGLLDPRVFKGGNNLHVVMDRSNCLWNFKMEHGLVPALLRDRFTSYNAAIKHAEAYFANKSIKIKEVQY